MPELRAARLILFVRDMAPMAIFYGDVMGLAEIGSSQDSDAFRTFDAGGIELCLHAIGEPWAADIVTTDPPAPREDAAAKLALYAEDLAAAAARLAAGGAIMGAVKAFGDLHVCDGIDPEGNVFQLADY